MSRETSARAEHVLMRLRASADPAHGVAEQVFAGVEQRLALGGDAADAGRAAAGSRELAAVVPRASRWPRVARVAGRLGRWGGFGLLTGAIGYQLGLTSHEREVQRAAPIGVVTTAPVATAAPVQAPRPVQAPQPVAAAQPAEASAAPAAVAADAPNPGASTTETPAITPRSRSGATPTRARRARLAARDEAVSHAVASSGAQPLSMAEILERLQRAQSALRDSDPHAALAELDALDALEPGGALADERLVLRALALCDLGRVAEARHVLAELDERGPASIYRGRLEQSCAAALAR